jgi:hypothetical protein
MPDGNAIWDFKETLRKSGVEMELFKTSNEMPKENNLTTYGVLS